MNYVQIIQTVGFGLLFLLPVIESYDRTVAMGCLLIGSICISAPIAWKHTIRFYSIDTLFLCFLVIAAVSTTQSISLRDSFAELLRYCAYFLLFVSVRNAPNKKVVFDKFLLPFVLVNSIILASLYFLSANPWWNPIPAPPLTMNLFYPTWGYNRIAVFLLFAVPLLWNASNTTSKIRRRILYRVLSLGFFLVIALTVARGVLLSLAFALGIYVFIKKKISRSWQMLSILSSSAVILILVSSFIYSNILYPDEYDRWQIKNWYKPARVEHRFAYIQQAVIIFYKYPLFGSGLDTFRYASGTIRYIVPGSSWYVHNHFLELFTETGLFGGSLFILFIFFIYTKYMRSIISQQSGSSHGLFIALTATTIHSFLDYDWHYISIFLIVFLGFALIDKDLESDILKV